MSFTVRLEFSLVGLAFFLVAVPFLANKGGQFAFYSVFIMCFSYGFFSGIFQTSIYQMTGLMPPKYMGALVAG